MKLVNWFLVCNVLNSSQHKHQLSRLFPFSSPYSHSLIHSDLLCMSRIVLLLKIKLISSVHHKKRSRVTGTGMCFFWNCCAQSEIEIGNFRCLWVVVQLKLNQQQPRKSPYRHQSLVKRVCCACVSMFR